MVENEKGEVVATCGVWKEHNTDESMHYELRKMYVHPGTRGKGLGRLMLKVAEEWCIEKGVTKISLDTCYAMKGAIALYESAGFVRDDTYLTHCRCDLAYCKIYK